MRDIGFAVAQEREVGWERIEAPYHALVGSAQQDTARALRQAEIAQKESARHLQFLHSTQLGRERDFDGLQYLFWTAAAFFWWAIIATCCALYFYFH